MQHKTIALTSASETAIAAASHQLLNAAVQRGVQLNLLQGVRTAHEAQSVYQEGGELWRIGFDDGTPELNHLVDRHLDASDGTVLSREVEWAFNEFLGKRRIA